MDTNPKTDKIFPQNEQKQSFFLLLKNNFKLFKVIFILKWAEFCRFSLKVNYF